MIWCRFPAYEKKMNLEEKEEIVTIYNVNPVLILKSILKDEKWNVSHFCSPEIPVYIWYDKRKTYRMDQANLMYYSQIYYKVRKSFFFQTFGCIYEQADSLWRWLNFLAPEGYMIMLFLLNIFIWVQEELRIA